ncbi:MAG TPA: hypothetical protein VMC42_00565 [Methanoregulaceae archaeon]|nr:hypothetical protein [Methanoregulaceae archaeon]
MKFVLTMLIVIVVTAVLATGCTTTTTIPVSTQQTVQASPAVAQSPVIPNITGTWTGTMQGYEQGTGFSDYHNQTMTMIVTGQQGRIFSGHYVWTTNGTMTTEGFAGVIGPDGTTLSTAEEDDGYSTGFLTSGNVLELTWHHAGPQYGVAIDSLKKI